jgi:hypothetical protein
LIAGEAQWISSSVANAAFRPLGIGGALAFSVGIVLGMLNPVGRRLRQGRCVRCGTSIERGQSYCRDHLRDTLNEYQDQMRRGETLRSQKNV